MTISRCFIALTFVVASTQMAASQTKKPPIEKIESHQIKVATFSGSESRIGNLYVVLADCAGGPLPEWRVVNKPKQGELRFEKITTPISQKAGSSRAHCNGKPIDAIAVYYQSKDGFVGEDRITLDVNYKVGFISRHVYLVEVR